MVHLSYINHGLPWYIQIIMTNDVYRCNTDLFILEHGQPLIVGVNYCFILHPAALK